VEIPIRAIREQIAAALDVIVQIARLPDGRRRITHISEVTGIDPETQRVITEDVFIVRAGHAEADRDGRLRHTGYIPEFADELIEKGFLGIEVFT